jgi:hypothetical protein
MSNENGEAVRAGALLEDAIAVVLLNETKNQRYTATEMQKLSGVKSRSWGNYLVNRSREIPTSAWVSIGAALGMDEVEVIRRARALRDSLTHTQVELLAGVSGRVRVDMMRDIDAGRGGKGQSGASEDPRSAPGEGRRSA